MRPIAIYADHHADLRRLQHSFEMANLMPVVDLGDFEMPYIGRSHPLRTDQTTESTLEAILRNGKRNGEITAAGYQTLFDGFTSLIQVHQLFKAHTEGYEGRRRLEQMRFLNGNGRETWHRIFNAFSTPNQSKTAMAFMDDLHDSTRVIKESEVEFIDGIPNDHCVLRGRSSSIVKGGPLAAVLYLPWKASLESVRESLAIIDRYDVPQLAIMSHDHFGPKSLPPSVVLQDVRGRPWPNEEQVTLVHDYLRTRDPFRRVDAYFGHIDRNTTSFHTPLTLNKSTIFCHHADEAHGKPLYLNIGAYQ